MRLLWCIARNIRFNEFLGITSQLEWKYCGNLVRMWMNDKWITSSGMKSTRIRVNVFFSSISLIWYWSVLSPSSWKRSFPFLTFFILHGTIHSLVLENIEYRFTYEIFIKFDTLPFRIHKWLFMRNRSVSGNFMRISLKEEAGFQSSSGWKIRFSKSFTLAIHSKEKTNCSNLLYMSLSSPPQPQNVFEWPFTVSYWSGVKANTPPKYAWSYNLKWNSNHVD